MHGAPAGVPFRRRPKNQLYHITSPFVKRKFIQKLNLPDPAICALLPIAFLIVITYNNNCQGEMRYPHTDLWLSPKKNKKGIDKINHLRYN